MPARIAKLIYTCSATTILALVIATIAHSAQLIHFRMEVANSEQEIAQLNDKNEQLNRELAQVVSLQETKQLAEEQGYVAIKHVLAIDTPSETSVALR